MPAGSVTRTSRAPEVAKPSGASFCGTFRSAEYPVGLSACVIVGRNDNVGSKLSSSQPV